MKVIITKCSGDTYWYINYINQTFDVLGKANRTTYTCSHDYRLLINKMDCVTQEEYRELQIDKLTK